MAGPARPLLLGHRGCRLKNFSENSLAAFRHAVASLCDGFEFDVRLTADGRMVCVHDTSIGLVDVAAYEYEKMCKEYLKSSAGRAAETIPCLDDVLKEFGGSAFLDIELKVAGLERQVLKVLKQYAPHDFVVSSFLAEILVDLAELDPALPLGFIFDDVGGLRSYRTLPVSHVMPRQDLVDQRLVEVFHREGKKVLTWTVNRPDDMARLADWGVDGLISDDPALLYATMRGR
jgi:glycerophosphoryl diester phosphodiesterase